MYISFGNVSLVGYKFSNSEREEYRRTLISNKDKTQFRAVTHKYNKYLLENGLCRDFSNAKISNEVKVLALLEFAIKSKDKYINDIEVIDFEVEGIKYVGYLYTNLSNNNKYIVEAGQISNIIERNRGYSFYNKYNLLSDKDINDRIYNAKEFITDKYLQKYNIRIIENVNELLVSFNNTEIIGDTVLNGIGLYEYKIEPEETEPETEPEETEETEPEETEPEETEPEETEPETLEKEYEKLKEEYGLLEKQEKEISIQIELIYKKVTKEPNNIPMKEFYEELRKRYSEVLSDMSSKKIRLELLKCDIESKNKTIVTKIGDKVTVKDIVTRIDSKDKTKVETYKTNCSSDCPVCGGKGYYYNSFGIKMICLEYMKKKHNETEKTKKLEYKLGQTERDAAVYAGLVAESRKIDTFEDSVVDGSVISMVKPFNYKVVSYTSYKTLLYDILSKLRLGELPDKSYLIGAPNGFGKTTFVNESIMLLHAQGKKAVPYISLTKLCDIRDKYNFNAVHSPKDNIKTNKNQYTWIDYIEASVAFVALTGFESRKMESNILKALLQARGLNGLPTIVTVEGSIKGYVNDPEVGKFVWEEILPYKVNKGYDKLTHIACYKRLSDGDEE